MFKFLSKFSFIIFLASNRTFFLKIFLSICLLIFLELSYSKINNFFLASNFYIAGLFLGLILALQLLLVVYVFIKLKKFLDSFKYLKFYSQKVIGKEDEKRLEKFMDFEKYPNLKKVTKVDKDRLIKYER